MKTLKTSTFLKIVHFLLGSVLFLVPVFFIPVLLSPFVEPRTFLFLTLVEVASFFYVLLAIFEPSYRPKRNYIFYSFLVFLIVNIVSGIFGADIINSFWSDGARGDSIIVLSHVFVFFLIFAFTVKSNKVFRNLLWLSISSAFLVAVSVYLVYLDYFKYLYFGAETGNIDYGGLLSNDSYTGVYLLFNVFFIIYLITNSTKKISKILLSLFIGSILASPIFLNFDILKGKISLMEIFSHPSLILGSARAVTISLFLSLCLMICLYFLNSKNKIFRLLSKVSIISFFSGLFLFAVLVFIPHTIPNQWFSQKTEGHRFIFWQQAVQGFKERPLLGFGPYNFYLVNERYFNPTFIGNDFYASENMPDKAHNIVFETIATTGLLGLISYLSIYYFSLRYLWRNKNIELKNKLIFIGVFFAYFLQSMVFFDVLVSYLMFAVLLAGVVVLERGFVEDSEYSILSFGIIKKYLYILVLVFIFLILSFRYFVFLPLKESYLTFNHYKIHPQLRAMDIADRNFSLYGGSKMSEAYAASAFNLYLGNFAKVKEQKDLTPYLNDIDDIIKDIIKNSKNGEVTYWGAHYIFQLTDIKYQLTKDSSLLPSMMFFAEKGVVLLPNNIHPYINKGRVLFYEGKYLEAINILEKALLLSPGNFKLHFLIVDIARISGDKKLLDEKLKRAEMYIPKNQ